MPVFRAAHFLCVSNSVPLLR
ncbi:hypothetical protein MTBSS4_210098 [Magnetospirillum sp. SS-4]|nr:hypothetical protein MTBSS4_210098 [Magnetospirillum sp. SS-4]